MERPMTRYYVKMNKCAECTHYKGNSYHEDWAVCGFNGETRSGEEIPEARYGLRKCLNKNKKSS